MKYGSLKAPEPELTALPLHSEACLPPEAALLPGAGHHLGPFLGVSQNVGLQQPGMVPQMRPSPVQLGPLNPAAAGPSLPRNSSLPPMHGNPYQSNPFQTNLLLPDSSSFYGGPYYGP